MDRKKAQTLAAGGHIWTNRRIGQWTERVAILAIERTARGVVVVYDGGLNGECCADHGCFELLKPSNMLCLWSEDFRWWEDNERDAITAGMNVK